MVSPHASLAVTLLLGLLIALTALAIDTTLPALPALALAFDAQAGAAQLTLTAFFAGVAAGQLLWGPISDRHGRRPVLLAGLALACVASGAAAAAPGLAELAVLRCVQGLTLSCAPVIARSVVRDLYSHEDAARLLARMMVVFGIVPIVAPLAGGQLLQAFGWRSILVLHALVVAALFGGVWRSLAETAPRERAPMTPRRIVAAFRELIGRRAFMAPYLVQLAAQCGIMAWITNSSFALIRGLGLAAREYALVFAFVMLGQIAGAFASSRLVKRHGIGSMLRAGTALALASGTAMAALAFAGATHWSASAIPMAAYMFASGFIVPQATAAALTPFPQLAGAASSLMGAVQFALGALLGALLAAVFDGTPRPMALAVALGGALCFAAERWRADGSR